MSTDHPYIFGKVSVNYIVHFEVVFHIIELGVLYISGYKSFIGYLTC